MAVCLFLRVWFLGGFFLFQLLFCFVFPLLIFIFSLLSFRQAGFYRPWWALAQVSLYSACKKVKERSGSPSQMTMTSIVGFNYSFWAFFPKKGFQQDPVGFLQPKIFMPSDYLKIFFNLIALSLYHTKLLSKRCRNFLKRNCMFTFLHSLSSFLSFTSR